MSREKMTNPNPNAKQLILVTAVICALSYHLIACLLQSGLGFAATQRLCGRMYRDLSLLLASLTPIPIVVLSLTGAGLMVATKCLRADEAIGSLEPRSLLLLAAAIPMGHAMETTGLAQSIVDLLLVTLGSANPFIFLSVFYLVVNLLAQLVSAKAIAVLFTPIALTLAASLGFNPTTLLMAIVFATAASFLTRQRHELRSRISNVTGLYRYEVDQALKVMIARCRVLRLRLARSERETHSSAGILLAMLTTSVIKGRKREFWR